MKALEQVAEFHKTFNHPILDTPQIPNEKRAELRKALLTEEVKEFVEAVDNGNLIGAADALCDIQYVLAGAVLEFGLKDVFPKMFDEVQRSNMSKACTTQKEAEATIEAYLEDDGTIADYVKQGDKFLVYRTHDRKTLKSINYSPANLKQFIENGTEDNSQG